MQTFPLGSRIRLTETFTDLIAGISADPSVITLKVRDPSGTETSYTLAGGQFVRDSLGVYHFDLTLSSPGIWMARWVAGGTLIAVDETQFNVTRSAFSTP